LPQVVQAVTILVHMGTAAPCGGELDSARRSHATAYNSARLRAFGSDPLPFASPLTGSGLAATAMDVVFARARAAKREPVEFAWSFLAETGQSVTKAGKPLASEEEKRAEIARLASHFNDYVLPLWHQHGVL
jgi:hypothetical protein